jgi:hypothetical protein
MSAHSKRARLWLRPARKKDGKIIARATYLILDAGKHYPTGCFAGEAESAERKLAEYIASKYAAPRRGREIDDIPVADVLSIYVDDRGPKQRNRAKFDERIARLNEFWGAMLLSEVTGDACRRYEAERGSPGGARRDLEDLRAAINHHAKEGLHRSIVRVALPEKGPPRDRWLTSFADMLAAQGDAATPPRATQGSAASHGPLSAPPLGSLHSDCALYGYTGGSDRESLAKQGRGPLVR